MSDSENEEFTESAHVRNKKKRKMSMSGDNIIDSIKKKKKKKRKSSHNESVLEELNDTIDTNLQTNSKKKRKSMPNDSILEELNHVVDTYSHTDAKVVWDQSSTRRLFKRIEKQRDEKLEGSYKLYMKKLNWEKVAFKDYTVLDCKAHWKLVYRKVRTERTITEIIEDANKVLDDKPYTFHVGEYFSLVRRYSEPPILKLKKPVTGFFLYSAEIRDEISKKYPNKSLMDHSKIISEKYKKLSEEIKEKYHQRFLVNNEKYKINVIEHSKLYPQLYPEKERAPKSISSMQLYLNAKCAAHIKIYPKVNKKEIVLEYKKRWNSLSDNKKIKYINKVQSAYDNYAQEADVYIEKHADFKKKKSFLTVNEMEILERFNGKPLLEYKSSYQVYKAMNPSSDNDSIIKEWKYIKNLDKNKYIIIFNKQIDDYETQYEEYIGKMPDDLKELEREKMIKVAKMKELKEKKVRTNSVTSDKKSSKKKTSSPSNDQVKKQLELIVSESSDDED